LNGTETARNVRFYAHLDSAFHPSNFTMPPTGTIADTLYWDLTNVSGFATVRIQVTGKTWPTSSSTLLKFTSWLPTARDTFPDNNLMVAYSSLRNSHDPNDKLVYPSGQGANGVLAWDTTGKRALPLTYTIRFQNTGNDTAFVVKVVDTIAANLDIHSLRMIGASHPFEINFNGRIVTWLFKNIKLPDSTTNHDGSIGYFSFSMNVAKPVWGTKYSNKAAIYFDYNAPVITNAAVVTPVDPITALANNRTDQTIWAYPNPTHDKLYFEGLASTTTVELTNTMGQIVRKSVLEPGQSLDMSGLSSGLYIYHLSGPAMNVVGRVVKE
jgi:hypothetical protein